MISSSFYSLEKQSMRVPNIGI